MIGDALTTTEEVSSEVDTRGHRRVGVAELVGNVNERYAGSVQHDATVRRKLCGTAQVISHPSSTERIALDRLL
jgi:hypothetical protein